MTIDTAALRELCEKATPGPWNCRGNGLDIQEAARLFCVSTEDGLPHVQDENDIAFIAAARAALPELLDKMEKLEKVVEAAGEAITDLGPKDKESDPCPVCHTYSHKHWCWYEKLKKALRDAGYGG